MYDIGLKPSIDFLVPTIVIGNLNVGGSGKTPMTELLITKLKQDFKLAVLSRGYGRKTKGFLLADGNATPTSLGDEPYQIYQKFKKEIVVAVGEERAIAIPNILAENDDVQLILLDDAFQHRAVKGTCNILLSEFAKPFYDDTLLPAGRLRESAKGAARADAIIITKTPDNTLKETKEKIAENVAKYAPEVPVFFAGIQYGQPLDLDGKSSMSEEIVLVTGIANPLPLKKYLLGKYKILKHFRFSDHHRYTKDDVSAIIKYIKSEHPSHLTPILTTEKDFVKLTQAALKPHFEQVSLYFQPMEMLIDDQEDKLMNMILAAIHKKGLN